MLDELLIEKEDKNSCKGLIFRGYHNEFFDPVKNHLGIKEGFKLLKRKSCSGCNNCVWIFDIMLDMVYSGGIIYPEGRVKDKGLYKIKTINGSRDFETGIIDDFQFEIYEVFES